MDEQRIKKHIVFAIIMIAIFVIYDTNFAAVMMNAGYYRDIYNKVNITNGKEYHGTVTDYCDLPNGAEDEDLRYAVVSYETERGAKKVTSSFPERDRKASLGSDVIVLDNGSRAVIQQDLTELQNAYKDGKSKKLFITIFMIAAIGIYILINKFR